MIAGCHEVVLCTVLAVRARFCTNYVAMLADTAFAKKSRGQRAALAEEDFVSSAVHNRRCYNDVLEAHFRRNTGHSAVNVLYATVRGYQFAERELDELVMDGVCFIPYPAAAGVKTLTLVEEVS